MIEANIPVAADRFGVLADSATRVQQFMHEVQRADAFLDNAETTLSGPQKQALLAKATELVTATSQAVTDATEAWQATEPL